MTLRTLAWKAGWVTVPCASVIEVMEEVGVEGPGSSGDEFRVGHIAFHMPGKMSST